ncbi:iron permease [Paenibacillus sp. LMG 31456]|uniref:Iron permease n=1 Tax=Paenibacillus foliorum TaxID=2654974 RepID=A0A972H0T9_9BACL|nr:iron permease [Paenibacillus foliorum]
MKRTMLSICMFLLLIITGLQGSAAAAAALQPDQLNQLIALSSDALISSRDNNWEEAVLSVNRLKALWEANTDKSAEAQTLSSALLKAEQELAKVKTAPEPASEAISSLAKAVDRYVTAQEDSSQPKEKAHKQIGALLPQLNKSLAAVTAGNWPQAKQSYNSFVNGWYKAENLIRNENAQVYGNMELKISGARIALNIDPPDAAKSTMKLQELITAVEDYVSGKAEANATASSASSEQPTIGSLLQLLEAVQADVQSKQPDMAANKMDGFIAAWPSVEGVVITRAPDTYSSIETKMVAVPTLILSNPPNWDKASSLIAEMRTELQPFAEASSYTAWDAALILFREGLEAILIIVSLLTFLNKSGNADKRKWIWSGAAIGLVASAILAVILSIVLSNLTTGSSRETIEGITGLVAVLFMLTIGAWLHKKSNLQVWNRYVEQTLGTSLARGTLWSLGFTAFLAVIREGAETIIFYFGMVATIGLSDLVLGIVGSLVVLALIGYAITKLSSRIPVRPFFLAAGLLLYYMAFKFIGVSVHALQVTGRIPAHSSDHLFNVPKLGIYPSWETTVPQLVVLAIVLINLFLNTRRKSVKPLQPTTN